MDISQELQAIKVMISHHQTEIEYWQRKLADLVTKATDQPNSNRHPVENGSVESCSPPADPFESDGCRLTVNPQQGSQTDSG